MGDIHPFLKKEEMLRVVTSKNSYKAREQILVEMKKRRGRGKTQLIIVPDRFAMSAESEIIRDLNLKGAFDIVVASFMKLAKRVLGERAKNSMTREGAVMLLSRAILKTRDRLKVYKKASYKAGFASELYAVIATIRKNCYSVDDLRAVTGKLPPYIKEKCEDILLVYEEYVKELSLGKMDGSTLLEDLKEEIPESDFIAHSDVYFLDFFSYTGEQKRVIEKLITTAESVTLLNVKGEGENRRIYNTRDVDYLVSYARKSGERVEEIVLDGGLDSSRDLVADRLFSYTRGERVEGGSGIKVFEAESLEGEVEHLARTIVMLTKEGYRYRDISILAGDVEATTPYVKRIFRSHGIPVFTDEKTALSSTAVARYILKCSKLKNRIEVSDGVDVLKSPYSGADESDVIDFQNHCSHYNIERLNINKPIALGQKAETYEGAERARQILYSSGFSIPKEGTAGEFSSLCVEFLDKKRVGEITECGARVLEEKGDALQASTNTQAVKKLYGVFEQIDKLLSDATLTKEEFDGVLQSALEEVNVSNIPMYVDSVYVGGAEKSRYSDCKVFCIVGAQSGALPLATKRTGILGESEERALKKYDIDLSPTAKEANVEEMLHLTQLLIMQKERLYISYTPNAGVSEIVDELNAIFSDITINNPYDLYKTDVEWIAYFAPNRAGALYSYTHSNGMIDYFKEDLKVALGVEDEREKSWTIQNGKQLFFPYSKTSVSQLQAYFTCPYKHFVEYGLRARSEVKATSPIVAGNFLHSVFEEGVKAIQGANYPEVGSDEYKAIVKRVIEDIADKDEYSIFKNEGYTATIKRLKEEGERALEKIVTRIKNSEYKPYTFEYEFGKDIQFKLKGEKVELVLKGKIDRIDRLGDNVILLDYKTGTIHGAIKDVYYGNGLQLALYMKAIDESGVKSVGAFYYPIQDRYEEEEKSKFIGNVLPQEFQKFDTTWVVGHNSEVFGIEYDKKAQLKADGADVLVSQKHLQAIKDYSEKVTQKAIDEIVDGWIERSPIDDKKCEWCLCRPLCDNAIGRYTRTVRKGTIGGQEDEKMD